MVERVHATSPPDRRKPLAMLLEASGLTITRPGDAGPVTIVSDASISLREGTLTDVVGPSGSGKTTLLLALARLLPDVRGDLALEGRPASEWSPQVWRTRVALLPQTSSMAPGSVADNLLLPYTLRVRHRVPATVTGPAGAAAETPTPEVLRAALDRVGLADIALDRPSARLSVGQASRVALLRVLLTRPAVLLLDEPDAALDNESAAEVAAMTGEFVADGGAVVRVRHLRTDAGADALFRLEGGRLTEVTAR
jgi:putative ABC transport system ATP-binding protein